MCCLFGLAEDHVLDTDAEVAVFIVARLWRLELLVPVKT